MNHGEKDDIEEFVAEEETNEKRSIPDTHRIWWGEVTHIRMTHSERQKTELSQQKQTPNSKA